MDTAYTGSEGKVLGVMDENGIDRNDVSLILLAHGDFDHYPNATPLTRRDAPFGCGIRGKGGQR